MAWSFDVASNIPRLNQSGTETGLAGIATAIGALPSVARSTAYTTAQMVKPPTPTGFWYRCSTAGTTAATAPTYGTTLAGTTTDGTAVFTAFKAPDIQTLGTTNHYYMPDIRMAINGTLTNANVQQQNFTCYDLIIYTGNFTSGAWATDGVTPLYDGVHFAAVRSSGSGADGVSMSLQAGGQFTFIGGEVQTANGVTFDNNTTPRSYYTRWRNTKEYGASSARFRSYTTLAIFQNVETYDFAFDLFRMPTVAPSIKARGSEYVYQYVGASAGGADAKFAASNLENVNGTYDFDNYFGGWVELYNCAKGVDLNVVSQYPNSSVWVRHCVPLYQDIAITAKDTTGTAVQDVRFTATESPTNAPTVTFTTVSALKTWDFRTPLSYQTTTNASGIATSTPVLNVWYWQTSFKESLRFPSSTAVYQGRAYNYKTLNVSALLGASSAVQVSAGMISLDTATTVTESVALAQTGITFAPSGATGGTVTISSSHTLQDIWNYYRAWISAFANRASDDTWTCLAGTMTMGAWNLVVNTGVTLSGSGNVTAVATTGSVTNNGTITALYSSAAGASTTFRFESIAVGSSIVIYDASGVTKYFQGSVSSAGDYNYYIPPGTTGTYYWAIEKYGKQRESGSFAANTGGLLFYAPLYVEDVGVDVTNQATVAAYTEIETASKFYDRTALFRLTEQGIKLGQIATRSGTAIEIGTFSHVINKDAASVYSVSGSTITTKSTAYAGDSRYTTEIATPPATITANTVEVITIIVEDAQGNSQLTINGGDGTFELWKVTTATATADYATGTLLATVGNGVYRFIGVSGFDIVGVDTNSNIRRRTSMAKGIYTQAFYVGEQIQLAQAPEVLEILTKVDILQVGLDDLPQTIMDTTVETGATVVESLRLHNAVLGAKVSGAGTGIETFRDLADTKDRLISTVDSNGNRLSEVDDLS